MPLMIFIPFIVLKTQTFAMSVTREEPSFWYTFLNAKKNCNSWLLHCDARQELYITCITDVLVVTHQLKKPLYSWLFLDPSEHHYTPQTLFIIQF